MADVAEIRRAEHHVQKTPEKQGTYRNPKGVEKQLDYILVNRKYLKYSRDAEAIDMIHMGSDHRSIMTEPVIPAPKKKGSQEEYETWRKNSTTDSIKDQESANMKSGKNIKFEERYNELEKKTMQKPKAGKDQRKSAFMKPESRNTEEQCWKDTSEATNKL